MFLLAHTTEDGHVWSKFFEPWEIHPMLNHLAIAFLLAGVAVDCYARWRGSEQFVLAATRILLAGLICGVLTAAAGLLAFFTVPAHSEEAHTLMYWHLGIQAAALLLFGIAIWKRWPNAASTNVPVARFIGLLALAVLLIGSAVGGYIVYHGGAGVDPELLSPAVRESHTHGTERERHGGDHQHETTTQPERRLYP